jgi:endonuclease YncB( thermonuclease family)
MRRDFFAVTLCALTGVASPQATLTGLVVGVTDGDTLTLFDVSKQQHNIRLAGIDAPESGQPFGNRAKQSLAALAIDRRAEDRATYAATEIEAPQAGRGLWRDRIPVPPWEWQEGQRKRQPTAATVGAEAS